MTRISRANEITTGAYMILAALLLVLSACAAEIGHERLSGRDDQLLPPAEGSTEDGFIEDRVIEENVEGVTTNPEVGVTALALGDPGSLPPTPEHGGNGGTSFEAEGGIIYAVRMRSGDFVDQVQFAYYVPSNPNNHYTPGDLFAASSAFGGNGGTQHAWTYCPPGYAAVGIQGRSGTFVDRLGLVCGRINNPTSRITLATFGGNGGSGFYNTCGSGYMSGLAGREGDYIDRIQGLCRTVN